ncbi:MAG: hypothetical protein ACR2PL_25330 [Dehalococcoidia bacterium]
MSIRRHLLHNGITWLLALVLGTGGVILIATRSAQAQVAPVPTPRLMDCSQEGSLSSINATNPTQIYIVNLTGADLRIYWLDYSGNRVLYGTLADQANFSQATYFSHPWVVTDASNRCVALFLPRAVPSALVLGPA